MTAGKKILLFWLIVLTAGFSSCGGGSSSSSGSGGDDPFSKAASPGDKAAVTISSLNINFIYANNQASITFPYTQTAGQAKNDQTGTITRKFFIAETEVTNALFAKVLNWAYENGKITDSTTAHNRVNTATVYYGGQELIDLDAGVSMKISYSSGTFSVAAGYENHPVVFVSWYGSVIFCNWLTEMRDGDADNIVYSGISTSWDHSLTAEDASKNGYRLPSNEEWEYSARYIGKTAPTAGNLAAEYIAQNINSGDAALTAGYYWTPAMYASGAVKNYTDSAETATVSWFAQSELKAVAGKLPNQLGIYDMSGNVEEWCFNGTATVRAERGGSWSNGAAAGMWAGCWGTDYPQFKYDFLGFRIARTQ